MMRKQREAREGGERVAWLRRPTKSSSTWRYYRVARLLFKTLWVLIRERNRVMRAHARGQFGVQPDAVALRRMMAEFRETALALGGLMIKLGQFLSARADLLPQEALAELALLQDEVPPEPFGDIVAAIERELEAPLTSVFASIERTPAGSASLGQVHRARLRSGQVVAVKVQRPDIERLVRSDLNTLRFVLGVARWLIPSADAVLDTRRLYREFSHTVYEELDYRREGHNAERFARLHADARDVVVPAIVWERTTRRVLTLTWVDGIKVSDVAALDIAGVSRRAVAQRLLDLYLTQVLQHGYFHADPHPGNIFVQPVVGGFRLAFVDFGMMGAIAPAHKRALGAAFTGAVRQNAPLLVQGLEALGFIGAGADREALEQALAHLISQYGGLALGAVRELDLVAVLEDFEGLLYGQPFRLPYHFAFLGRALATLAGLVTLLAPEINFVDAVVPYARAYLVRGGLGAALELLGVESVGELAQGLVREGLALAHTMAALPHLAERVLDRIEQGDLRLGIYSPDFNNPRLRMRVGSRLATRALNRAVPAWVPLGVAGVAALALALWRHAASPGRR
jgi:predicted unusual protein kinase regulating ubiquinone biosynthesis (AarF/ABC1/UbiB family)